MSVYGKGYLVFGYFIIFTLMGGTGYVLTEFGGAIQFGNGTLCDFMDQTRDAFNKGLVKSYPNWKIECVIFDDCNTLNCSIKILDTELKGGFKLNLCKNPPSVYFWKGSFWSHIFKVSDEPQRVEVEHQQNVAVTEGFLEENKDWFLTILLNQTVKSKVVELKGIFDICDHVISSSKATQCSSIQFIKTTSFPLSQICEMNSQNVQNHLLLSAPRQGRLDLIHMNDRSLHSSSSSQIGHPCPITNPFYCGIGATCRNTRKAGGICECDENFKYTEEGGCTHIELQPNLPADVVPDGSESSSSSAALGAVLSIIVLILLAGFIFLGTKYHVFHRIRNRLPYLHCWPFQRGRILTDHVSMVNPISSSEDDEPSLL